MCSVIIAITMLVTGEKPRLLLFAVILINIFSLAFSFSRGYWVATAVGVGLILLLSEWKIKRRMLLWGLSALLFIFAVVALTVPAVFRVISEGILFRLTSIGYSDISFQARLVESRTVLDLFLQSPFIGYGFGSIYSFYDLITKHHALTWYIHNGYFFLLFKVGIIGFLLYFAFYISRTLAIFQTLKRMPRGNIKSMLLGFSVIPVVMLLLSYTSPQFYDRASVLILTVVWGMATNNKYREIA
jgi:O-antigen ligase